MPKAAAAKGAQHPSRQRKREAGLSAQQRSALNTDFLEEEEVKDRRQQREMDDVEEVDAGELPEGFEDEEISSDEDEDMPVPARRRRAAEESEDEQSIGSSVDEDDLADLSTMLNDGEDEAPRKKSNASMLSAVGLAASERRAGGRHSERVEAREEDEYNAEAPDNQLTVDALLGGLGKQKGFGQLQKSLAALSDPAGGKRGAARAQLGAPLERSDQRRVEREAATVAAHREVSKWDEAVRRHDDQEYQVFPRERAKAFGASTGSLAALKPEGKLEGGVEALLKQHGLEEGKAAQGEELALSSLSPEEVIKRRAELRKMRDLLFYHETKAKRAAKIKSKAYRKVHKKGRAKQQAP